VKAAGAVIVVVVALVALFADVLRHPAYTPDGIVYARFAARDAGYSQRDATLAARAFYDRTPLMNNPRYRALVDLDPSVSFARSKVFENRVLYPWIVGTALAPAGFRALFDVNAVAYVAFGLSLFWMLCAFRNPGIALALTIVSLALPLVRQTAGSDLTDMTAMVWWTLALGALLRLASDVQPLSLAVLAAASALLTLTRPTPYLVVIPAVALTIVARTWLPLLASLSGIVSYGIVALETHAYGVVEQLRWVYQHRPDSSTRLTFDAWYRTALAASLRYAAANAVRTVLPVLAIAATILLLRNRTTRRQAVVLAAAAAACLIAIPFNPVPSSFARVIALPLIPIFCGIAQCIAEEAVRQAARTPAEAASEIAA
jgi:hypothetical protein